MKYNEFVIKTLFIFIIIFHLTIIYSQIRLIDINAVSSSTIDENIKDKTNVENNITNNTTIIAAIVAAIASITAASIAGISGYINNKKLKQLEKIRSEEDALLSYEYEARKRLYQNFEPLLFLLAEHSENAIYRIENLAKSAKDRNLGSNNNWLSKDEYYLRSTLYRLLIPLAIFKLMQKQLTTFDLELIPDYKLQYNLTKVLYHTFSSDFEIASLSSIEYDPDKQNVNLSNQIKYWKQGVNTGLLDKITESLLVLDHDKVYRIMSLGEYEKKFFETRYSNVLVYPPLNEIIYLFLNFHPNSRPILWTILIIQVHIYAAILRISNTRKLRERHELSKDYKPIEIIPIEKRIENFDWRQSSIEKSYEEVFVKPFNIAETYLQQKLGDLM